MNIPVYLSIIIIFILIFLNGLFAATETALIRVNDSAVEHDANLGNKKAKRVLKFIESPTQYLSAVQIGITIIGFLNGVFAAESLSSPIVNLLLVTGIQEIVLRVLVLITITLIITFLQVVLGELVPKKIGMKYNKKIAYNLIGLLNLISLIAKPFVFLLTKTANGISFIFGIKPGNEKNDMSEEEIKMILDASTKKGVIEQTENKMINNIFEFNDTQVGEIMTHRTEIAAIDINSTKEAIINFISLEKYTRYPVYSGDIDHIIGTFHSKDLLKLLHHPEDSFDLKSSIRRPHYVPEAKKVDQLFREMQKDKNHIAVVLDEYGGTAGIITIEDIIEEIVGNIFDEYDEVEIDVEKISDHKFIASGLANISDIEDEIQAGLPTDDYDTLSGFILGQIGRIPETSEEISFEYNNHIFKVLDYNDKVIEKVEVIKKESPEEEAQE